MCIRDSILARVDPHPMASDKNTILNVLWVFKPGVKVDVDEVLKGAMNAAAECYVDVGGERDQCLYEGNELRYTILLGPKSSESMLFLLESPAGGGVPMPGRTAWTPEMLRKAAADVWSGYDPDGWR